MKRSELLQEIRTMRFEEAFSIWTEGRITQEEAARMLGVCERSFRRYINRYHDNGLRSESRLFNSKPNFSNRDRIRKRVVRFPINRSNRPRLAPADHVIIFTQAFSTSKVRFAVGFVQPTDQFEATLFKHHDPRPIRHPTIGQQNISGAKDIPHSAK